VDAKIDVNNYLSIYSICEKEHITSLSSAFPPIMKPICIGGMMSVGSLVSTIIKSPLFTNPSEETKTVMTYIVIGVVTAFIVVLSIAIASGSSAQTLNKEFPLTFRLAAQFRTPMLMFIVVPLSYIRSLHVSICDWYRHNLSPGPKNSHEERVGNIVNQVKKWNTEGRKSTMRTARPNWAAMSTKLSSNKGSAHQIATHELSHILEVDTEKMTIRAEPCVTMGQITHHLVPKGYALLIQVEMESITIGGVSMGFGMETNSHVIGFFQESVVAYEIVTSTGEVVNVSKESDPELFYALPWSCGTIGFLASVTVRISKVNTGGGLCP
jgi:hypothetical protein